MVKFTASANYKHWFIPQTTEIRHARASSKRGELSLADYEAAMKKEIEYVVRRQEELDLDVLVHGEAERNDMVEF